VGKDRAAGNHIHHRGFQGKKAKLFDFEGKGGGTPKTRRGEERVKKKRQTTKLAQRTTRARKNIPREGKKTTLGGWGGGIL